MPRHRSYRAVGDIFGTVAAALSQSPYPEDRLRSFLAALGASVPGLSAWLLRRQDRSHAASSWVPAPCPPPFPEALTSRPGSIAAFVLQAAQTVEIGSSEAATSRAPEAPYLRRRAGLWRLVPAGAPSADGVLVLHHAEAGALRETGESIRRALTLIEPGLAILLHREELERRVEERTQELALFYETSRALAFAKAADEIATILGHHLGPALGLQVVGLIALQPGRRELFLEIPGAAPASALLSFRRALMKEASSILGEEVRGAAPRVNRPARLSPRGDPPRGSDIHAVLSATGGRPIGFLMARATEGALDESHLRLFYTAAGQAALTLERMRLVEQAGLLRIGAVLDSMREGVLLVDRSLEVLLANPAAHRFAPAILGGPLPGRLRRLGQVSLGALLGDLATGDRSPEPAEIVAGDGEKVFTLTASAVRGLRGVFEGAVLVLSDVTEQRRLQEQLVQADRLSSLGEMISGVAHELNNPLASIIGFSQLLEQRDLEPDIHRKVGSISAEASRCHRIVQNLLRFARRQAPDLQPVDLNSVVGSVVQLLGYQLQADDIALDVDLDRGMRHVRGDFHALQQVFVNLIQNAHHAMREKGGQGLLRIVTRCDGAACRVEVSDTGIGIEPEHLRRIFDPFFSTKKVGQGTGLGLSLAYATIRAHDGAIQARSRPGQGTTFTIEIPVATGAVLAAAAPAVEVPVEAPPPGRRILVVEDESSLALMIREALSAEGHVVETVADGVTARRRIDEGGWDLIISDLKMPNMGGRELYEVLRVTHPEMARRIIFSTGDSVSAETEDFFRKVGNPCLTKPYNLRDLFRVVNTALRDA